MLLLLDVAVCGGEKGGQRGFRSDPSEWTLLVYWAFGRTTCVFRGWLHRQWIQGPGLPGLTAKGFM